MVWQICQSGICEEMSLEAPRCKDLISVFNSRAAVSPPGPWECLAVLRMFIWHQPTNTFHTDSQLTALTFAQCVVCCFEYILSSTRLCNRPARTKHSQILPYCGLRWVSVVTPCPAWVSWCADKIIILGFCSARYLWPPALPSVMALPWEPAARPPTRFTPLSTAHLRFLENSRRKVLKPHTVGQLYCCTASSLSNTLTYWLCISLFGNFNFNTACMKSSAVVQLERLYLTFAGWLKVPRPFSYQKKPTCGHNNPAKAEYFTGSNGQSRTSLWSSAA